MTKVRLILTSALCLSAPMLVSATSKTTSAPEFLGPVTRAFPRCDGNTDPNAPPETIRATGVIKIILPRRFEINNINRVVKIQINQREEAIPTTHASDVAGTDNVNPGGKDPFHVFLKSADFTQERDYILVRVIIRRNSEYRFFDEPDQNGIHGVGWSKMPQAPGLPPAFCGARPIRQDATNDDIDTPRQIASFYIRKAYRGVAFDGAINIGIVSPDYPETAIFIDPKVHNDG